MSRRVPRLGVALLGVGLLLAGPGASAGQPETCPNPGPETVDVAVTSPEPDSTVSGVVTVEGTVASAGPVFRVELFVGDARKDVVFLDPPATTASFSLRWDSGNRPAGPATLGVLACGGEPAQGSLTRGVATVDVAVVAPEGGPSPGGALPFGEEDGVSRAPSWVGLVVGAAGVAGLAWASGAARKRPRPEPDAEEQPDAEAVPGPP